MCYENLPFLHTLCVCNLFSGPLRVEMLSSELKYPFDPPANTLCEDTRVFM